MATSTKKGSKKPKNQKKVTAKKIHAFNKGIGKTKEDRLEAIVKGHKITYFHKIHVVPLVVKKLKNATSRQRFVSGSEIVNSLYKHHGIKITTGLLRSILHYIRINGILKCLLATGQGYFITNDTLEMQVYLKSLRKRIRQIGALVTALDRQGHEKLGKQISTKVIKTKKRKASKKHGK